MYTLGVGLRYGDEQAQCPGVLARCRVLCDEMQIRRCQMQKKRASQGGKMESFYALAVGRVGPTAVLTCLC